jgi:hypothetical protein
VTTVLVIHGFLSLFGFTVVVTILVDSGTSKEQAEEIVLSLQVDSAVGVHWLGRLAGVATADAGKKLTVGAELVKEVVVLVVGCVVAVVGEEEADLAVWGARFLLAPLESRSGLRTFNLARRERILT